MFVISSKNSALLVDTDKQIELDIDEEYNVQNIKETVYLPLENSFYFICNTYNNSNGLYVLKIKE